MNKYEEKYINLISGENVNVSKSDLKNDLFAPIGKVICVIFIIFIICEIASNIFVTFMPSDTQRFVEKMMSSTKYIDNVNSKYPKQYEQLEKIKR